MKETVVCCYIFPIIEDRFFASAEHFARSYAFHSPGLEHKLLIVLKSDNQVVPSDVYRIFEGLSCEFQVHPNEGYDIASYITVARQAARHDLVCCIGAYTSFRADNWLAKLCRPMAQDVTVGLVGAFGSYELNPHIRTSLFVLRASIFQEMHWPQIATKVDGFMFECGPDSLTQRMLRRGAKCLVVDCEGNSFGLNEWGSMGGFRQGDQSKLLAWDNHCEEFARGDEEHKKYLRALARF
jgi:hypothetical protein